jgi:hypothetical protein
VKVSELMKRLATLNPEAEVYVYGGWCYDSEGPQPLEKIERGIKQGSQFGAYVMMGDTGATPSDTLIVLSE